MAGITTRNFLFILLFCIAKKVALSERKCEKLDEKLWKPCVDLGFTHTFAIPDYTNQSKLSFLFQKARSRHNSTHNSSQCLGEMTDMMLCSFYVPHCDIKNDNRMVLPCKRVCAEYLYKCKAILFTDQIDMLSGRCNLLLDYSPETKACMEPKNFQPTSEAMKILDGKCHDVVVPICKRKYNYTLLRPDDQKELFVVFYGKNYTESANVTNIETTSILKETTNNSECLANLEFILCSLYLPPCFPSMGRSYYTVCQNTCRSLLDICPMDHKMLQIDLFCSHAVDGNSPSGFCKHTYWASHWFSPGHKWSEAPGQATPVAKGKNYGWIAAAVLIPIVFALLIIGAVYYWKRYRLKRIRGYKPKALINEDDPKEGEL